MFEDSQNPYLNQPNPERPPDTAVNIQHGHTFQRNSFNLPRSLSYLPMDLSSSSKVDYAERVVMESNRMDIELFTQPTTHASNIQTHTNDNEVVSNALCQSNPSTIPILPSAIPYEANVPVNPNL